jgi:hypothetical protein
MTLYCTSVVMNECHKLIKFDFILLEKLTINLCSKEAITDSENNKLN